MRGLAGILERKLAGIEDEYRAFLGDAFGPREARALAVGSRACAGRQALVYLASLIGMGDEVTREHQATGARRLIALSVAIGRVGCVTPAEVVCDSIDGMSCDRDTMLQVARAIDDELEDRVRAILLKTPPPPLGSDDGGVDAAHIALDASDVAVVAIARLIEQRAEV
jgi:hypothetical protein